jgi:hypothetical protein
MINMLQRYLCLVTAWVLITTVVEPGEVFADDYRITNGHTLACTTQRATQPNTAVTACSSRTFVIDNDSTKLYLCSATASVTSQSGKPGPDRTSGDCEKLFQPTSGTSQYTASAAFTYGIEALTELGNVVWVRKNERFEVYACFYLPILSYKKCLHTALK